MVSERRCDPAPAPAAGSPCSTGDTLRPPHSLKPRPHRLRPPPQVVLLPQVEAPPPPIEAPSPRPGPGPMVRSLGLSLLKELRKPAAALRARSLRRRT
ncbi:hypothetical protein CesoFtcFv8_020450 [Champsocephalus esox]|uniref:Uncharacterized protein n=1 Tax=Champsocephalus esox TaxID=159716 RepID=A0AAN8BFC7_9TELE|nr:hypothetical protein CesoFtcFv8_020450 [Champsocephalus esox]